MKKRIQFITAYSLRELEMAGDIDPVCRPITVASKSKIDDYRLKNCLEAVKFGFPDWILIGAFPEGVIIYKDPEIIIHGPYSGSFTQYSNVEEIYETMAYTRDVKSIVDAVDGYLVLAKE